jgi:protease-4
MSTPFDPSSPERRPPPLNVIPATLPPPQGAGPAFGANPALGAGLRTPPPRSPAWPWSLRALCTLLLLDLLACNIFALLVIVLTVVGTGLTETSLGDSSHLVHESHFSGKAFASDKIAILHIDGVLMEGLTTFARKEIERAAADNAVKAVVVRINSPGGSITASDDLHQRLVELRDGNAEKKTHKKPLIVSMASVAASGGYYIAMPAETLVAERTTITGSIGVYVSLPNLKKLGDKYGFEMHTLKAGEVKDSGSMFHDMTDHERDLWQHMVDESYLQFLHVVEQGRPHLKGKLQQDIVIDETVPIRDEKTSQKQVRIVRYRADGGIFLAEEAKKYGLIDQIGYLEDAVKLARQAAGLSEDCRVVEYQRPATLLGTLFGAKAEPPQLQFDLGRLAEGATPRLWYMAPHSELAGFLAAAGQK